MSERVSIIIRTKNEERWISQCLEEVFSQTYSNFEVIVVDNNSEDRTVRLAQKFPIRLVTLDKYTPGLSINHGIRNSTGVYLVLLSGHCIPTDKDWLSNLVGKLKLKNIAGVYGRQLPMSFSSAKDKRDLFITFGLDPKIQKKDSFFHNANSAIKRSVWEQIPFDENVTNIEDRIWASHVLEKGYQLYYEPSAKVYHHHGIHHDQDINRAQKTLSVMENISSESFNLKNDQGYLDAQKLNIISLIPVKGNMVENYGSSILDQTINYSLKNTMINQTIILTDNPDVAQYAKEMGAVVPFLRDPEDSKNYVDLSMVYMKYVELLENEGILPDLVVSLEPTFIFRPANLVTDMVEMLIRNGFDSVMPVTKEYNAVWSLDESTRERLDEGDIPRNMKSPLLISVKGLGIVTYPEYLRQGRLYGDNCGTIVVDQIYSNLEIRNKETYESFMKMVDKVKYLEIS
jgi:rhamnosyltransferase